ncbi:hypothetical protein F5Y13DRAFT_21306 [Hypoxylon sp. FL1857]|nr:hypothetical protein F5Y13DRAFT_21306 [Hypoxylon sp. FL1857]
MMGRDLLPKNISLDQFRKLLARYDSFIESTSSSKKVKPGQKTLLELDRFRYHDTVALFHSEDTRRPMKLDDVKTLVDWKLRHGQFRPSLMKLVSENDETPVEHLIQEAVKKYRTNSNASKALNIIAKLRGVGPATASLLLSVHEPKTVIFFSDEAFYWLCRDGHKSHIKYNSTEYEELSAAAQALVQRLGVDAVDIEKVAYVLMKEGPTETTSINGKADATPDAKPAQVGSSKKSAKRKSNSSGDNTELIPLRRSKRGKASAEN